MDPPAERSPRLFTIEVSEQGWTQYERADIPKLLWASDEREVLLLLCMKLFAWDWGESLAYHQRSRKFDPEYKGHLVELCSYATDAWPKNGDFPDVDAKIARHSACRIAHACGFKTIEQIDMAKIKLLSERGTHVREIETIAYSAPIEIKEYVGDIVPVARVLIERLVAQ